MRVKFKMGGLKSQASEIDMEGQGFEMLNMKILNELKEILKDAELAKDLYGSRAETRLKGSIPSWLFYMKWKRKLLKVHLWKRKLLKLNLLAVAVQSVLVRLTRRLASQQLSFFCWLLPWFPQLLISVL